MDWREEVDKGLKPHLESQIKETHRHKNVLEKAPDPISAQLWLAIASLSKQIFDLNIRINYMERLLQDALKPKSVVTQKIVKKKIVKK